MFIRRYPSIQIKVYQLKTVHIQRKWHTAWTRWNSVTIKNAYNKYVLKHKYAKLFMTYAVGKLEAALNISHLILVS